MDSTNCTMRLCQQQAAGKSPISCLPLCTQHMEADLKKCEEFESLVEEKIAHFKKCQVPLRLMQQRLASDLQMLDDTFHELREALDKAQSELTAAITKHHEQLLQSLKLCSEFDSFEKDLQSAKEAKDFRLAFCINEGMKKPIEDLALSSKLVCIDEKTQEVKTAAFPDVNSRVIDLMNCVETQLFAARIIVENLDASRSGSPAIKISKQSEQIQIGGSALCIALCNNTSGLALDKSGIIIGAQNAAVDALKLQQPIVFVAVEKKITAPRPRAKVVIAPSHRQVDKNISIYEILIKLIDSKEAASHPCSWDADKPIKDLHCDNDRQLLFIAQEHSVTVTDLCGNLQSKIAKLDLSAGVKTVHCIAGDFDKLLVLAKMESKEFVIMGLSKESNEVQFNLKLPKDCDLTLNASTRIAVHGRMLLAADDSHAYTICGITGHLLCRERIYCDDSAENVSKLFFKIGNEGQVSHNNFHRHFFKSHPLPRASLLTTRPLEPERFLRVYYNGDSSLFLKLYCGRVFICRTQIYVDFIDQNDTDDSTSSSGDPSNED